MTENESQDKNCCVLCLLPLCCNEKYTIRSIVCEASCHDVNLSSGLLVNRSSGHQVTRSPGHQVVSSQVIMSSCHPVIQSFVVIIIFQHCYIRTGGRTDNIRVYRSASQTIIRKIFDSFSAACTAGLSIFSHSPSTFVNEFI